MLWKLCDEIRASESKPEALEYQHWRESISGSLRCNRHNYYLKSIHTMTLHESKRLPDHRKRPRSPSPSSCRHQNETYKRGKGQPELDAGDGERVADEGITERKEHESFAREQTRLNQIQEAERMREWVSQEDNFVLKQSKKKAQIRVREGRAKPIDWLAVTLSVIDSTTDPLEEEGVESDVDVVDPAGIFEGMGYPQLQDLGKEIDSYLILESNRSNRDYWNVGFLPSLWTYLLLLTRARHSK